MVYFFYKNFMGAIVMTESVRYSDIVEVGYAKINLHLDVVGKLADGYHAVNTVMQSVSLYDEITITDISIAEDCEFFVSCNIAGVPLDGSNLVVKAAKAFCAAVQTPIRAKIDIQKNIPMAAGMAGGSADAAAVLRGLNRALGEPLSIDELCDIGKTLGADVPFCIVGGTRYADRRGDELYPFPKMPKCALLVACEGEGVSTPWAYRLLDTKYDDFADGSYSPRSVEPLKDALLSGDIKRISGELYNIFEEPVLSERPVAARIKSMMEESGALVAMMSGSGPSVFGVFMCPNCARRAAEVLEKEGYGYYICEPV